MSLETVVYRVWVQMPYGWVKMPIVSTWEHTKERLKRYLKSGMRAIVKAVSTYGELQGATVAQLRYILG